MRARAVQWHSVCRQFSPDRQSDPPYSLPLLTAGCTVRLVLTVLTPRKSDDVTRAISSTNSMLSLVTTRLAGICTQQAEDTTLAPCVDLLIVALPLTQAHPAPFTHLLVAIDDGDWELALAVLDVLLCCLAPRLRAD